MDACVRVCVRLLLRNVISTSSALAVAGKELVKQQLQRHVLGHDVVFAQVMAAGRAGIHLRSERPLETSLGGERERETAHGRGDLCEMHGSELLELKMHPVRAHLANVV